MPLNTARASGLVLTLTHRPLTGMRPAVLAVQNMEAHGSVAKAQEIEFKALEGSLSMMSKGAASCGLHGVVLIGFHTSVLNDVLDL